jgi:hypothetical protein
MDCKMQLVFSIIRTVVVLLGDGKDWLPHHQVFIFAYMFTNFLNIRLEQR